MSSSALEKKVHQSLLNLNREKSLKDLFWSQLNYDRVNKELSRSNWSDRIASELAFLHKRSNFYRDRLENAAGKDLIVDNEISKQLADFQKVAVKHAIQNIRDYNGTFVADVVGLGKSFIGAAIAIAF